MKDAKGGSIEFRVEKAGIVHAGVGKASFTEEALAANVKALVDALNRAKPSGAKGTYVKLASPRPWARASRSRSLPSGLVVRHSKYGWPASPKGACGPSILTMSHHQPRWKRARS